MSDNNTLYQIAQALEDPYKALDIFEPKKGKYLRRKQFKKDILKEVPTVEQWIKNFYEVNGYDKITVYIRKKNGSSFKPVAEVSVTFQSNNQTQQMEQPTQMPTMPQTQSYGMSGAEILNIHDKASKYGELLKAYEKLEVANEKLKEKFEEIKEKLYDFKNEMHLKDVTIKEFETKVAASEKPMFSDKGIEFAGAAAKDILGMVMTAKTQGMGGAATPIEAEVSSAVKQKCIDLIRDENFTDEMTEELEPVVLGIYSQPNFTNELRVLIQKYQPNN